MKRVKGRRGETRTGQDRDETEKTGIALFKIAESPLICILLVHTWNQLQKELLMLGSDDVIEQ